MNEYLTILNSIDQYWLFAAVAGCLVIILILIIILLVTAGRVKKLERKLSRFTTGREGSSLEDEIEKVMNDNKAFRDELSEHDRKIGDLYLKHEWVIQKTALVKYDAFKEMGGKLSSVIALLDGHNDGVLINVVHSTSGSYTYTKSIREGQCSADLGEEEKAALDEAVKQSSEGFKNGAETK